VPLQARAVPSFGCFGGGQGIGWQGCATAGTGRTKLLASQAQNFFYPFS